MKSGEITAHEDAVNRENQPSVFTAATIYVVDRDVRNLAIPVVPALPLSGEVVWDGDAPQNPVTAKVGLWMEPLFRASFQGEHDDVRVGIPDTFSLPSMLMDDYSVRPFLREPGLYIKDIVYGNLVNKTATNISGDVSLLRVAPGDAGGSMLYIKLTLKTVNDLHYGAGMPLTTPGSVCPEALDAFKTWIDDGAKR